MTDWSFRRHMTAALRVATVVVVALTIFWTVYGLAIGPVPTKAAIRFGNWNHGLESVLMVNYNRWLDVPYAFLAIAVFWLLYALILKGAKAEEKTDIERGLIAGMIAGFIIGFAGIWAWHFSPDFSLALAVILGGLGTCLYPALKVRGVLVLALVSNFIAGIADSIIAGVGNGMATALLSALVTALTAAILIGLGIAVIAIIANFRSIIAGIGKLLGQFGRWLTAANVDSE